MSHVVLNGSSREVTRAHKLTDEMARLCGGAGRVVSPARIGTDSMKMRPKAVEKFRDNVRKLTRRSNNLDAKVLDRLNALIRGTANYFGTSFSSCVKQFTELDQWLRMRLRCMKYKRKPVRDHYKLRVKYLERRGLISLVKLLKSAQVASTAPRKG